MKTLFSIPFIAFALMLPPQGAQRIAAPVSVNNSNQISESPPKKDLKNTIHVAVLLDTSNSMDGLIDQAKAQLWELVNELSHVRCDGDVPNLEIALYEYGNDNLNMREGYVRQVLAFTKDLDEISKQLFGLTTNGGSEHCGQVIQTSLDQLTWGANPDDLNLIFIAGNEPFTQGPVHYQNAVTNACEKNITVNTIFCGNYAAGVSTQWQDGAIRGKGQYMAIDSDRATVYVPSPYDDEILKKNTALNATYIAYGAQGRNKKMEQKQQDENAASYGKSNAVARTLSKSSTFYEASSWDLVDATKEDDFELQEVVTESLPEELQGKDSAELREYIEQQSKKRAQLQKEIAELNGKRDAYVASKTKADGNPLKRAMVEAIREQGKARGYGWE